MPSILALTLSLTAQERTASAAQADAFRAYAANDYQSFLAYMVEARTLSPDSFSAAYNIACGYALTGRAEEALAELEALAEKNIFFALEADADFSSLRGDPRFDRLNRLGKAASSRVATSRIVHRFDQWDFGAEGLAIDPGTGRLFFGSRILDKINVIDEAGNLYDFTALHDGEKPNGAIGLRVDSTRRVLWAAGRRLTNDPEDVGMTSIFGFDLETAERKFLIRFPGKQSGFGFNDLVVLPDGKLLATGGTVYRIDPEEASIWEYAAGATVQSGNGIALSGDGAMVYVADFDRGVYAIDLQGPQGWWIAPPDDAPLVGIDGLYEVDGALIAVQQGISPWRVAVYQLDKARRAVTRTTVLERAHPDVVGATTGAVDGRRFFYIGRGRPPDTVPSHVSAFDRTLLGRTYILETTLP